MHFLASLLIMVIEIRLSISNEILSKFAVRGTHEYQRITSNGSRTIESQWPGKRDKTGFFFTRVGSGVV